MYSYNLLNNLYKKCSNGSAASSPPEFVTESFLGNRKDSHLKEAIAQYGEKWQKGVHGGGTMSVDPDGQHQYDLMQILT